MTELSPIFQGVVQGSALAALIVVLVFVFKAQAAREKDWAEERKLYLVQLNAATSVQTKLCERMEAHDRNTNTRHDHIDERLIGLHAAVSGEKRSGAA